MARESATLTALPNGITEDRQSLRVTMFVTPRLSTDGAGELKLSSGGFPAFADWPATLSRTRFSLVVENVDEYPVDPDPRSPATSTSSTWHELFDKCVVRDGTFNDLSDRTVRSFPASDVAEQVLDVYRQVAEGSATSFPPITSGVLSTLAETLGTIATDKDRWYRMLDGRIRDWQMPPTREGGKTRPGRYLRRAPVPPGTLSAATFAEAYRFYDRPGTRDPAGPSKAPRAPRSPRIDFHGFVAFCGDYPNLLRELGLAVDLLVPNDKRIGELGRMRFGIRDDPTGWMDEEQVRPWTNFELTEPLFVPRPRPQDPAGDVVDGMLRLESESHFLLSELDLDGAAMKVVDFAANLARVGAQLSNQSRSMTQDASSLPALRTGGFTISRDNRAARVVGQVDHAADHDEDHTSGKPADLFVEDVTRGYRLDVEDGLRPGRWLSLHRRNGTYTIGKPGTPKATPLPIDPDEGYVKGASASSTPGDDDLYLHETVIGWDGWSLAAKRPGQAIMDDESTERVEPDNTTNFPLFTEFKATPGTLPRMRFGRQYRFRVRTADLAGNSVADQAIDPRHASSSRTLRRFDPVPSPAVIPRRPFSEGESLLRMVIRSTLGSLPHEYVGLERIRELKGHTDPMLAYEDANERHVAPPNSSQQLAEWHGVFDAGIGKGASSARVQQQYEIAAREAGSFLDPAPGAFVYNPDPNVTPTDLSARDPRKAAPLKPGEYVCHDTEDLSLPYLPDPLSFGPSFTTLPGSSGTWLGRWKGPVGRWYDRRPIRIRIEEGGGPPKYDSSRRLLTVFLPQAEMVTVQLSSCLADPASLSDPTFSNPLELMAIWMEQQQWVRGQRAPDALQGLHWMVTPWQLLTLVHAVEKPLAAPEIEVPPGGVTRRVGETFAVLDGALVNHAKSTGRLDIEASWSEPIDDPATDAPSTLDGHGHVTDFLLESTEDDCRIGRDETPRIGAAPPVHKARHEFGDTKHRHVTYEATATTRFREYFPQEITGDPSLITSQGPGVELNVPSSRRPDPPIVLYVVPTWTWDERRILGTSFPGFRGPPTTLFRTRTGGGLRVYLNRPWYSSGDGELLGVVLEDQPWITWPIDIRDGLQISAVARAQADELAERTMAEGMVRGAGGGRSASAAERMIQGIRRSAAVSLPVAPRSAPATAAERAFVSHELAEQAVRLGVEKARSRFSAAELTSLAGVLAKFKFVSGDPQKFVTHWGLDPIWGSAPMDGGPFIHQFPLRVAVGTSISLLEAPGHGVTVVGHTPEFDPDRKLWFCDVQVDAGQSYFPFIRLALARYQPDSIDGQQLSPIVMADFAQLVAERTAAMTRVGSAVAISIRGPGGFTEEAAGLAPSYFGGTDSDAALGLSRFAVAQVERLPAGAETDLAWSPVGDEVHLDSTAVDGMSEIRFSGRVPLPSRQEGEQLRLALREYEVFLTDESESDSHIVSPRSSPAGPLVIARTPIKYRLVYADHVPL
jgi:hypothetical protein